MLKLNLETFAKKYLRIHINMQKKIIKPAAILVLAGTIAVLSSGCYFFPDEEPLLEPPTLDVSEVVYYTYTVTRKDIVSQTIQSGYLVSGVRRNE